VNKLLVGAIAAGFVGSSVFSGAGVAAGDEVLIVPGTAPPDGPAKRLYHFKPEWVPTIAGKYYINPRVTNNPGEPGVTPKIITYPAANPVSIDGSMSVGDSVAAGADNLDAAIRSTTGPMTVVGLSQGSEVITQEQLRLANDPTAPPPDQITFIKVSDPAIVLRRLFTPGTHLPYVDYTVPPPVESQYNTVNVVSEYDFVGDPPDNWLNLLAVLNSGMGLQHTMVAFSDPASVPPEDIIVTTNSRGGTTTTYRVPAKELPLTTQLRAWGLPNPVADRLEPVMRPIVDTAYDRDGDPSSSPQRPLFDPLVNLRIANLPAVPIGTPLGVAPATVPINTSVGPAVTAVANEVRGPAAAAVANEVHGPAAAAITNQVRALLPKEKQ
jgi:3'-(hydroxy)phthioceranyl-2'-palmitoyl(stearoyl)-2-O-sulfo-trehalose (hydroxy)phthioceranyltransferase